MSLIGKKPIPIPAGVTVQTGGDGGRSVSVKGPKGTLSLDLRPEIEIALEGSEVKVSPNGSGSPRLARAYHGMTRALLGNMVLGVSRGFSRKLEIVGVGWNAQAQPKKVVLNIGLCHPVDIELPAGITAECPNATTIILHSADKQAVGQLAARIRKVRPPEPYKGKGIRYEGEYVRRKSGKSFGS